MQRATFIILTSVWLRQRIGLIIRYGTDASGGGRPVGNAVFELRGGQTLRDFIGRPREMHRRSEVLSPWGEVYPQASGSTAHGSRPLRTVGAASPSLSGAPKE